jgi:hypothetical protein
LREALPNLIVDEPLAPLATPVHLTADRFGTDMERQISSAWIT